MHTADIFLNEIKEVENGSKIVTTHDYVGLKKVDSIQAFKEFKPLKPFPLSIFFFAIIIFHYATWRIFLLGSSTESEIFGFIVLYLLIVVLIVNADSDFYSDETMNYKIRVDNFGISLNDVLYKWENIYETAIMTKFARRSRDKYLVIAMNDMTTYECVNLANHVNLTFHGFGMTLAKYIEFFKPFNTKSFTQ